MATEGDKLHTLINRMAEIEAEQPAEEPIVEISPEEKAREELEQAVSHTLKIMNGVEHDSFKTEAEEILFEQIIKDLAELEERMRGPQ